MFDFHKNVTRYIEMQKDVTQKAIIPFLEKNIGAVQGKRVLEIGCGEAGVLQAFIQAGCTTVGVELYDSRLEYARTAMVEDIESGKVKLINKDIYDIKDPYEELGGLFDIIILKDVIEHIPDQARFIPKLKGFLSEGGVVFFAYPPWWMPFGGHQQICHNKWLQKLPWFHLLHSKIYQFILKIGGEAQPTITELLELKSTGINIEKIYRLLKISNFKILGETHWMVNPIYEQKFGLKQRVVPGFLSSIPYIRNFYTTAHYILFAKN